MGELIEIDTDHISFLADLENVINKHSKENDSNTPDFMLAALLSDFLKLWGNYCQYRDNWWGFKPWGDNPDSEN